MIKSFFNGVIGGFSRTLGRILFYIFIALIFYFIFGLKNVDAAELNVNSYVYSTMGNTYYQRMFTGYNYYGGSLSESNFSLGTTYSGKLKQIHFRIDRTFNYTNSYTLTLQANSTDFRNYLDSVFVDDTTNEVQCTTISAQFISKSKISVTFVCPYQVNSLTFHFYSKESYYLTGDTNFNIKNVLLEEHTSGQNNDDIINNNNSNTQDIINNNNSNTQDIINNQNELLGKKCDNLWANGDVIGNRDSRVSLISPIEPGNYTMSYNVSSSGNYSYVYFLFLDSSNNIIYEGPLQIGNGKVINFSLSSTAVKFRFYQGPNYNYQDSTNLSNVMLVKGNLAKTYCEYGSFSSGLDGVDNSINNLNSTLNSQAPMDSNIFSDWWSNLTENYYSNPLGNLITLPINLVQKLINYTNTACSPVQLGSLLGTNLTLTCFTLGDIITNSVVLNVIDLIMSLSLIVFTLKKAYETVSNLLSLGGENEVKQHFKFPTPMEFIASLFGGGR